MSGEMFVFGMVFIIDVIVFELTFFFRGMIVYDWGLIFGGMTIPGGLIDSMCNFLRFRYTHNFWGIYISLERPSKIV